MKTTFKLASITVKSSNVEYISGQTFEYGVDVSSSPFTASIEEVAVVQESTATEFVSTMKEVSNLVLTALEEQRNIDRIRFEKAEQDRIKREEEFDRQQKEHDEYIESLRNDNIKFEEGLKKKRKSRIKPSFTREDDSLVGDAASFKF